ncbi:MAG: nucleotidyltransferase domain-containing protein [Archaeoglobaceae archaeon]
MKLDELKRAAQEIFSQREEVITAYIYGSSLHTESYEDIDIGLFIEDEFSADALYEARIAGELERKLKEDFDVRILNDRPVRFLYSLLKNCQILYCKDESKRIDFESKVMVKYLDIKPHHQYYEKMRRQRYVNGQKSS